MNKIKDIKTKCLILSVTALVVLCWNFLKLPCIWIYLTGYHCPGCGMTRACISALKLDFYKAFSYHYMFWSVPLLITYFITDGNLFKNKTLNKIVFIIIALGFVINWIMRF